MHPASLAERAPLYRFAARLLAQEIDETLWASLGREPLRGVLGAMDERLAEAFETPLTRARKEQLDEEYARLFLLPGRVPPFAPHWLADRADRKSALDSITTVVTQAIRALGIDGASPLQRTNLPHDHAAWIFSLAAEFGEGATAANDGWGALFEAAALGPGWGDFGRALSQEAKEPIYRVLGDLLAFIHPEIPGD